MQFFVENKVCFEKSSYIHKTYFDTLDTLHITTKSGESIRRVVDFSFVTENMMVEATKMQELISLIETQHKKPFWEAILESIEPREFVYSGFSEFETYGNFIAIAYPHSFKIINRKRDRYAREFLGDDPSEMMLKWYARSYEVLGIETWDKKNERLIKLFQKPWARILSPKTYRYIFKIYFKIDRHIKKILNFYKKSSQQKE